MIFPRVHPMSEPSRADFLFDVYHSSRTALFYEIARSSYTMFSVVCEMLLISSCEGNVLTNLREIYETPNMNH